MAEFSVTSGRDGFRSFNDHDDRYSRGGSYNRSRCSSNYHGNRRFQRNRGYGGYRYMRQRGNFRARLQGRDGPGPGPRSRIDDDGDDLMAESSQSSSSINRFTPYDRRSRSGYRRGMSIDHRNSANNAAAFRPAQVWETWWKRSQVAGAYARNDDYDNLANTSGVEPLRESNIALEEHSLNDDDDDNSFTSQGDGSMDRMRRMGLPLQTNADGDQQWYKILIPYGIQAGKDFILQNITKDISTPFVHTYFHFEDRAAVFYVNDRQAVDALRRLNKTITMPNNYKMSIVVQCSNPPSIPIGADEKEKLRICMSNRYDPTIKYLDLSSLDTDKDLLAQNLYMALARHQVMNNVVEIIAENIPELVHLNLMENKLVNLEQLATLVPKANNIKIVNLSKNKVACIEELQKIKGWNLDWLTLAGNPLCDKFNDQAAYISAVRRIFPKVLKLDDNDLPAPITFDIEARTDLPKSKGSYFPNSEAQALIVKFIKDYFIVYDMNNRSALGRAYHDQAMFSLSMAYNGALLYKQQSLSVYIEESRNLVRTNNKDTSRKQKVLRHGSQIVSQLRLLPETTHDPNSFVVDCNFISASQLTFTIQGVFKEGDSKSDKPPIRAFSRTFITIPDGLGMLIVNDILTITNASPDQIASAFKNPAPTPSSSPIPHSSPTVLLQDDSLTEEQRLMILAFITDSRMNRNYSAMCLAQNDWNYERAGQNFLQLQQQGKIPPEAYFNVE